MKLQGTYELEFRSSERRRGPLYLSLYKRFAPTGAEKLKPSGLASFLFFLQQALGLPSLPTHHCQNVCGRDE